MYVHHTGFGDAPINTQEPVFHAGVATSLANTTQTCVETPVGLFQRESHTWWGYATPGGVFVQDGKPYFHPSRGLGEAIQLNGSSVELWWHLEVQGPQGTPSVGLPVPQVVLQATLRTGSELSVNHETFDGGALIAEGRTEPAMLGPLLGDHPHVEATPWEGREVYRVHLDLPLETNTVPEDGFQLRVDVWIDVPGCDAPDGSIMEERVRLFSGPQHPNRFTWDVVQPVRMDSIVVQRIGDDLVLSAAATSPFGILDLRSASGETPQFQATGPATWTFDGSPPPFGAHGDRGVGSQISTWIAEAAPDGSYEVTVTDRTLQGHEATGSIRFDVVGSDVRVQQLCTEAGCVARTPVPADATTPGPFLLAPLLLAVLLQLRRAT